VEFTSISKDENVIVSEFNNRFTKLYMRIPQHVCPNDKFALVYYFKVFDESFGFLLREKDIQNLEATLGYYSQDREEYYCSQEGPTTSLEVVQPARKTSQKPKKEGGSENNEMSARFDDLLQDLSNKMIILEKKLQNQ
jgi:hypothetical protein